MAGRYRAPVSINVLIVAILLGGLAAGRLAEWVRLPSVLGMTLFGVALGLGAAGSVPAWFSELDPFLKSFALIVILLRAGLGISRASLNRAGRAALLMAFVPAIAEGLVLTAGFHLVMGFPWATAGLTAFMIAAVSPAVVVPSMLDLRERGLGARSGVVTLILAGASVDDVVAITIFTLFLGIAVGGTGSGTTSALIARGVAEVPLSIALGIASGVIIGLALSAFFRRHHERIRATEKAIILVGIAVLLVDVGATIHIAALLGVMTVGFVLLERNERVAHELALKLSKVWVFAQIILFVLIGMAVDPGVAVAAGPRALALIALGLVGRSLGVLLSLIGSHFTRRERLFCVVAYLPKATVQAALGGVALARGVPEGETILAIAVLAIITTAPLGLIGIRYAAPRLLSAS